MKVLIIGSVALGPKAAVRLKRLLPSAEVTMIDKSHIISYGGCGIPYFISGDVSEAAQLTTTSFHMVRDAEFFKRAKGINVLTRTEALAIDRDQKKVRVRYLDEDREEELSYDKLVLATGSMARKLNIPGSDFPRVVSVTDLTQAEFVKDLVAGGKVERAVVLGGGPIGLEMGESLADLWGVDTTIIERAAHVLPQTISPMMAKMVENHLKQNDVEVLCGQELIKIEEAGEGLLLTTNEQEIETDLVISAIGVVPDQKLALEAGLEITDGGAIKVDSRLRTSDPDIYAGGDAIETVNLITQEQVYMPLGSLANRQGRIIGTNLSGAVEEFDGVVGSSILKVFDLAVAGAGLFPELAKAKGFDPVSAYIAQGDRAHFYPEMELLHMELTVDRSSGRVLGVQGLSTAGIAVAGRINSIAALLKYHPLVREISTLEIGYSPPFSAAMDIVNNLGNLAENLLSGKAYVIDPDEFIEHFNDRDSGEYLFLDVRGPGNADPFVKKFGKIWKNIPQELLAQRLEEVPRDQNLILICNNGARSYEAQLFLREAGIKSVNLQGGVAGLKMSGLELP